MFYGEETNAGWPQCPHCYRKLEFCWRLLEALSLWLHCLHEGKREWQTLSQTKRGVFLWHQKLISSLRPAGLWVPSTLSVPVQHSSLGYLSCLSSLVWLSGLPSIAFLYTKLRTIHFWNLAWGAAQVAFIALVLKVCSSPDYSTTCWMPFNLKEVALDMQF